MARTGDWITPRLWGEPWFEKPVLLYWMTGLGFRAGLAEELAPRLPVALLSVGFLVGYGLLLKEQVGAQAAALATAILATSAGWLAYSHVAVTDVPLSATFTLAMLSACQWLRNGNPRRLWLTGALLGAAVLAKGLVPLVLALPLVWIGRGHWRVCWRLAAGVVAVAAPWYVLCYAQNGTPFLTDFIWKHHVARFFTRSLEHVQPFWFYLPVLLGGLFPWTPLLGLLRWPGPDPVLRLLWLWPAFGLAFFSGSMNKLPGYVLPLLPPVCALLGVSLARRRHGPAWLAACALLMATLPVIAALLPQALETGIRRSVLQPPPLWIWLAALVLCAAVWIAETRGGRELSMALLLAAVCAGVWLIERSAFPRLDQTVSARSRWIATRAAAEQVCLDDPHRARRYGLNYYSGAVLPDCETNPRPVRIR